MILIGVAWLLILAIALYQSIHGLFSAVIMAFLTTVCAAVALGYYEWLGPAFLYSTQPAYADALSLILHFVIPLLVLRIVFDKLIIGNARLGALADRAAGGLLGVYIGTVMIGILTIALQMLPYGASVMSYKPFDSSLQRVSRIYCDEFALGVFNSTAGLATDRSYNRVHDDLLLELFCARNTAGKYGRVDAPAKSLTIPAAYKPGDKWKQVVGHKELPEDPCRAPGRSDVLIVQTRVSKLTRSKDKEDGWYRLPATHFRLVTESGVSLYPLGYIAHEEGKWTLHPAASADDGKAKVADQCVFRRYDGEPFQEVFWVYRLPAADSGQTNFDSTDQGDPAAVDRAKAKLSEMYEPDYMVFRRTVRMLIPPVTPDLPPEPKKEEDKKKGKGKPTPKRTARPTTKPKPRT